MCLRFQFCTHQRVCILHFLTKCQIRCTLFCNGVPRMLKFKLCCCAAVSNHPRIAAQHPNARLDQEEQLTSIKRTRSLLIKKNKAKEELSRIKVLNACLFVHNFILQKAVREPGYSLESPQNGLVSLLRQVHYGLDLSSTS